MKTTTCKSKTYPSWKFPKDTSASLERELAKTKMFFLLIVVVHFHYRFNFQIRIQLILTNYFVYMNRIQRKTLWIEQLPTQNQIENKRRKNIGFFYSTIRRWKNDIKMNSPYGKNITKIRRTPKDPLWFFLVSRVCSAKRNGSVNLSG